MKKSSRLQLKSADALKFSRREIREFAVQVRDRTQAFFIAGRQDNPLFVTPRITDATTAVTVPQATALSSAARPVLRR